MGSGASCGGRSLKVAGKETVIIKLVQDGKLSRTVISSTCKLTDAEQILVIVDPRMSVNLDLASSFVDGTVPPELKEKIIPFVLFPSLTSSKANLLLVEVALNGIGILCTHFVSEDGQTGGEKVHVVRSDDYHMLGDQILVQMLEQQKRVYPAEEAQSMLGLIQKTSDVSYEISKDPDADEDEAEAPTKVDTDSRFAVACERYDGWVDQSYGSKELTVTARGTVLEPLLLDSSLALPTLPCVSMGGGGQVQVSVDMDANAPIGMDVETPGLVVRKVHDNSKLNEAGVVPGDRIINANGTDVSNAAQLQAVIQKCKSEGSQSLKLTWAKVGMSS